MEKRVLSSKTIRVFAGLIDYLVLFSLAGFSLFFVLNKTSDITSKEIALKILISFPFMFILYCFKDSIYGISPGKYVVGIAVRDKDDYQKTPGIFHLFLRNIPLIIWPLEIIVLILSRKKQRIGDIIAKTIVVCNHNVKLCYILLRLFSIIIIIIIIFAISAMIVLKNFNI